MLEPLKLISVVVVLLATLRNKVRAEVSKLQSGPLSLVETKQILFSYWLELDECPSLLKLEC